MDNLTDNEIEKYLSGLSKPVLDLLQDKTWGKRVDEIALKYSLTEEQSTVLTNLVLFVLIGVESPETFSKSLETELGISELLAEQILADLDTRVFQYAADFIEQRKNVGAPMSVLANAPTPAPKTESAPKPEPTPKTPENKFEILNKQTEEKEVEIPPVILPMVESEGERKKVVEQNKIGNIPKNLPVAPVDNISPVPKPAPKFTPEADGKIQEVRFVGSEFVQKPIAVPRFSAVSAPEPTKPIAVPTAPQSPTPTITPVATAPVVATAPTPAPATVAPATVQNPPRYIDPYREPIE